MTGPRRLSTPQAAASGLAAVASSPASASESSYPARADARHGTGGSRGSVVVSAVAELLGTNEVELVAAGRRGRSLADVAESRGVDIAALVTALLGTPREATEQAVVAGTLGRNQADAIIERVADKLSERVTDPPNGLFLHVRPLGVPPHTGRRLESAGPRAGDDLPPAA